MKCAPPVPYLRPAPAGGRRRVLIVGGGFAGLFTALGLERMAGPAEVEVTLVTDHNFMLYTPFLPEVAAGTIEPRHAVVPLRPLLPRTRILLGYVSGIDSPTRQARFEPLEGPARDLEFDELIICPGSVTRALPIPGLDEYAIGFKGLSEAVYLRNHVLRQLELADASVDAATRRRHLTFIVVGGGYAGVEVLAELEDLTRAALKRYPALRAERPRWTLIEATDRIFPEVGERLGTYSIRQMTRRGIDIRLSTLVTDATGGKVTLSTGETLPTETLIWTAGVRPHPILPHLGLPVGGDGRLVVDATLQVEGHDHAWALGDAAAVPDPDRPGSACPPTAQHAIRQGHLAARNVLARIRGEAAQPFTYRTQGMFVNLGRYKGVARARYFGFSGFPAWAATRLYHLGRIPGMSRRLRVLVDWMIDLFFHRDIAELESLGRPQPLVLEPPATRRRAPRTK